MESVRDNIRRQMLVGKNFAQNSGIAMIQLPHGIERMGCVPCTRRNSTPREFQGSVRVPNTDTYSPPCGFRDHFGCAVELRRDRHHANVSTRSLPEFIEHSDSWRKQVLRGMNTPTRMAEEWTLQVNTQRARAATSVSRFHGVCQPL